MKRYISAILIPCFLLQLFGCYSNTTLTADNLKYLPNDEQIKITTISKEEYVTNDWQFINDTLKFVSVNKIENSKENKLEEAYKNYGDIEISKVKSIPISEIEELSFKEINVLMTILVPTVVIGAVVIHFVTNWSVRSPRAVMAQR
jgi:hypothetical protein